MDMFRYVTRDMAMALGISVLLIGVLVVVAHVRTASHTHTAVTHTTRELSVPVQQLKDDTMVVGPKK